MATATKHARRPRSDSTDAILAGVLDKAAGPMKLPPHIKVAPKARPFFDDLIAARPRAEWSKAKIYLAVQCAHTMASIAALATQADSRAVGQQRAALISQQLRLLRAMGIVGVGAPRYVQAPDAAEDDLLS